MVAKRLLWRWLQQGYYYRDVITGGCNNYQQLLLHGNYYKSGYHRIITVELAIVYMSITVKVLQEGYIYTEEYYYGGCSNYQQLLQGDNYENGQDSYSGAGGKMSTVGLLLQRQLLLCRLLQLSVATAW